MQSQEFLDYHAGLIRGFLFAHKAEAPIMQALKIILEGRRSDAGSLIGRAVTPDFAADDAIADPLQEKPQAAKAFRIVEEKAPAPPAAPPLQTSFFWSKAEDDLLAKLVGEGRNSVQISKAIGRPYQSVVNRVAKYKAKMLESA